MSKETINKALKTLEALKISSLSDLRLKLQEADEKTVATVESITNVKDFHMELKDTTNCIAFIKDSHNKTVFNIYDMFRVQFTTQQAKQYNDALLKDSRFYTHVYHRNTFISAKSKDINDFFSLIEFCYSVVEADAKQTIKDTKAEVKKQTTATKKQTATKKKAQ